MANKYDTEEVYHQDYGKNEKSNLPAKKELTTNDLPEKLRPLSPWAYFGYNLLFGIPVIGFILLIVFACGGAENVNLKNYARSFFIVYIIGFILFGIIIAISLIAGIEISDLLDL